MTQVALLESLLLQGKHITRIEASLLGIQNLTARVSDLRARGHDVIATETVDPKGKAYSRFHLRDEVTW